MLSLWRWRYACHKNPFVCCQKTDLPSCNSARDTHLLGRVTWRYHGMLERWADR